MPILYKPFAWPRTALCCVLAMFILMPFKAWAQPYVVEGVQVDISADNAINAKDKAFAQAEQDAFKKLATQLLSPDAAASFKPPAATAISPMIQDYEVTQEKLSNKRYIATYTFTFKERAVQGFFPQASAQSPDGSPLPITQSVSGGQGALLVLAFYRQGREDLLWSAYNIWMQAWQHATLSSDLSLPIGDLADIGDISDNQATSYNPSHLAELVARYNAHEAVIVIATPDINFAKANSDSALAAGSLKVDVYRTDQKEGPQDANQFTIIANPGETRGAMLSRAVIWTQHALGGDWKGAQASAPTAPMYAQSTRTSTGGALIYLRVPFESLQQWSAAQRVLNRIPGVSDVILKTITPREAHIGVVFNGSPDTLRIALQQQGMNLSQATPSAIAGFGPEVYDFVAQPSSNAPPLYTPGAGAPRPYERTF